MRSGVWAALASYVFWGLTPLFWRLLAHVPPVEQLAHRVLWSLPLILLVTWTTRTLDTLRGIGARGWSRLATGGVLLMINWATYVWAVANERVVEASLGYFITPIVSVLLGVTMLGERLPPVQWVSVLLAGASVTWMAVSLGAVPWVALLLAFSFGGYGLLQKWQGGIGAWASLGGEVLGWWPVGVALVWLWAGDGTGAFGIDTLTTLLLLVTGPVTVLPLLWFGMAARRLPLTTVGILQYVNPILQFVIGVWLFREPMPMARLVGFTGVGAAVVIYVWSLVSGSEGSLSLPRRSPRR